VDLLTDLNPQQQQAVTAPLGPVLVLAGPGSGKTRVLAYRIAYLIEHQGVPSTRILAVTFTNKAAREMESRVRKLLERTAAGDAPSLDLNLGTFHARCAGILRREAGRLPFDRDFVIYDESDQFAVVRQAIKDFNLDPKQIQPRKVHDLISSAKNEGIDAETFSGDTYFNEIARRIYVRYQELLLLNNALDFDDLLLTTVQIFEEHPDVLAKYQRIFPHILVDEFQDTNTVQYMLLKKMAGEEPDLFVVGDPDQSIYRWRGADYRNVHRFQADYPGSTTVALEQNYRSTQTILDAAVAVIDRNPNRHQKKLYTTLGEGEPITLHESYDENDEALYILEAIAGLTALGEADPGDCAVMYRTNAQSRALEEAFLRAGLPYQLVGAQRFYGRREIKDLIAYLRLVHNPADQVSLFRILNTPPRGIGTKTEQILLKLADEFEITPADALRQMAADENAFAEMNIPGRAESALRAFGKTLEGWIADAANQSLVNLIDRILQETDYRGYIDDGTQEGEERWANIEELRSAAYDFEEVGLTTFLEHLALVSDQDTLSDAQNAPTLLTLHAAKELEFPVVFIIGLDDGVLPHQRSFDDPEAMAEERRLFYVGITRAMRRLFLVRAFRRRSAGVSSLSEPSRFLADLPPELLQGDVPSRLGWDQISFQRKTQWDSPAPRRFDPQYESGMRVRHPIFGDGMVLETNLHLDDEEVTVAFESGETRHLVASLANLTILDED
jgi:DNA helicase-2/ATP-dependent DNA helicase PcrA